jgi:type III pantothenate kinase
VFDGDVLLADRVISTQTVHGLEGLFAEYNLEQAAVCSVRAEEPSIISDISQRVPTLVVSHLVHLPFTTRYLTPETLGTDRLAVLAGVATLYPGQDVLVVDAGTCITYDFMDQEAVHHGGGISPGIDMRFKALNHFTGKLPLVSSSASPLLGITTEGSIASGVLNGVLSEVEGIVAQYRSDHQRQRTILTGGDAALIAPKLKTQIFAAPNLVLYGLNSILRLNEVPG